MRHAKDSKLSKSRDQDGTISHRSCFCIPYLQQCNARECLSTFIRTLGLAIIKYVPNLVTEPQTFLENV